jgi:hypothetical protein
MHDHITALTSNNSSCSKAWPQASNVSGREQSTRWKYSGGMPLWGQCRTSTSSRRMFFSIALQQAKHGAVK